MSMVLDEYYEEITQGYQHSAYNRLLWTRQIDVTAIGYRSIGMGFSTADRIFWTASSNICTPSS